MAEDPLKPFLKRLRSKPDYLESFRDAVSPLRAPIQIYHFSAPDRAPERFTLTPYPFQTLYDLKVLIYQHLRKDPSAHPMFQCLLIPAVVEEEDPAKLAVYYRSFEYEYNKTEGDEEVSTLQLIPPFERVGGPSADTEFVSETGKRLLQFVSRSRMTLENFLDVDEPVVLHLFLFKDILPLMNEGLRASEREWFGRISPYFPDVLLDTSSVSAEQAKRLQVWDTYVSDSMKQLNRIDTLLTNRRAGKELLPISIAGFKFMRSVWKQPSKVDVPLETLFYQLNATHERPFLRILPVGASPITKLKMEQDSVFKIPDISDPRLLLNWKEERAPNPNEDYMFAKLIIRGKIGMQPDLYGTLRIQQDQSADFIFEPPKNLRLLDPEVDLGNIEEFLSAGFKGTPVANRVPEIAEANLICSISLPLPSKLLTKQQIQTRLGLFRSLFQEIPSLPGETPLAMLRYRAVSNYALEDRMYYFLQLAYSRELVKGEAALPALVMKLQQEFLLSDEEAQKKVMNWIRNRGQIQLADAQRKDYILTYNPGVDIAIYGQQSLYTIHLYRVDSYMTLRRILTAVKLLLSGEDRDFAVPGQEVAAAVARTADAVVVAAPGVDPAVAAHSIATVGEPPEGVAGDQADEYDGFGDADGDDMYVRLMLGAPGANAANAGDAEVFNMGNDLEEDRQNAVPPVPVANLVANAARANRVAVAEAVEAVPLAPAPGGVAAAGDDEDEPLVSGKAKKSYQGWIKSQLQEADQRLFQYKTDVEGRKIKKYVTMCQATESRQPFVLNKEQYDIMRKTYENEKVYFQEYPLQPGRAPPAPDDEVYTVLVYGTNPARENYYICCQFFCTNDYIMVREVDFKKANACPFCGGKEIKDLKNPKPGETVIQRRSKKSEVKRHLHIGFLQGETQHPEGFYLPCCFTEDTPLYPSDPRFDYKRREEEKTKKEVQTVAAVPATSYQVTLYRAHKKYIVGPEKEYLKISEIDGPQIGLLPPVLDKYFAQDPKMFVSREANKMELLPNADCFLRIAVENRTAYRYDSFFAAVAPYLDFRNTAADVKARIREVVTPRVFLGLNYGNLMLEFYEPGSQEISDEELKRWSQKELGKSLNMSNKDALLRLRLSYDRFIDRLDSDDLKQYRQYAQMLALPGLLKSRGPEGGGGLLLIVLELNEANELSVRCPPFGYNEEAYASSDIGFILHRSSGIWEPIFFSSNRPATAERRARHLPELTFQRSLEDVWPKIVQQRVAEFTSKCRSIGRAPYTSSTGINPLALLSVSEAMNSTRGADGVLRDSYNHIAALLFKDKASGSGLVPLPVVDDEYDVFKLKIYLDWDDFTPTTLEGIIRFYNENFKDQFLLFPGYKIKAIVRRRSDNKYIAVQLSNGLFLPVKPAEETTVSGYPITYVDQLEWTLNKEIAYKVSNTKSEESLLVAKESELHELYQHLRITFSTWFSGEDVSEELRKKIKKIIGDSNLPLYERRKRLEILLGPTIEGWMNQAPREDTVEESLLRVDCRLQAEPTCSGRCVWRQSTEEGMSRCYLHVPASFTLGGQRVSGRAVAGPRLLMLRLLEELIRFPEKRKELYSKSVSTLVSLKEAKRLGKDQYVLPEGSIAWYDLLRLDWLQSGKETKRFYEEMSRNEPERPKSNVPSEENLLAVSLPPELQEFFGPTDPKLQGIYLVQPPDDITLDPLLVPLRTSTGEIDVDLNATKLEEDELKRLTLTVKRPIVYIQPGEVPEYYAFKPARGSKTTIPYVFVHLNERTSVLSSSQTSIQEIPLNKMPKTLVDIVGESIALTPQNLNTEG